jgi:rod shape-determining protein MreD
VRIAVICVLAVVNVILESTLFQYTRINGIKPDFLIMLITAYAIMRGSSYGTFIGLGVGLLIDSLYSRTIGINAFSYMVTGYIIGQAHESVFKDSYIPSFVFNFIAVMIFQHIYLLLSYLSNNIPEGSFTYLYMLMQVILPQALYNAIVGAVVYRYIYKLDEAPFMKRRIY